jgi:predicted permease
VTGILFGVLPAFYVRTVTVAPELRDGARGSTRGSRAWLRHGLVAGEVALACALLVGTGLLTRSFAHVLDADLGYQPARAYALRADPSFRLATFEAQDAYLDDVLSRTRALPDVVAAGVTDALPFAGDRGWCVTARGQAHCQEAFIRVVTDGYFDAAAVPLRAGRAFTSHDKASADRVVVINDTLARRLWPGQNPLGQVIAVGKGATVVGVVGDVRHEAPETPAGGEMYLPMRQTGDYSQMQLVVRSSRDASDLTTAIRDTLHQVDPNLPVRTLQPLQTLVDRAVSPRRFVVVLLAGFAGFAMLLASLGIYAVISQSVNQRTQEIGIRMALGASASAVRRRILVSTLGLASVGLVIGLGLSRLLTAGLARFLVGVTPGDPATFAGIAALLMALAAVAGYLPAWRASRIDPMVTLRSN